MTGVDEHVVRSAAQTESNLFALYQICSSDDTAQKALGALAAAERDILATLG